jgi:hypothetical protein
MFLLGPREGSTVTTVAFAGTAGVTRRSDQFAVTGTALARLFRHAGDHDLRGHRWKWLSGAGCVRSR